ncbi:MAG: hypothetical protein KF734_15575 [Saprospiraceae bacterium]|nr:hypothetical protein [Saprospiraceae bacterium]
MRKHIVFLSLLCSLAFFTGCEEENDPDLTFLDYQQIWNPCAGTTEYLDVRSLYWVRNLQFPFNGYPEFVLLYWRHNERGFFDCFGIPWYVVPGSVIVSNRYLANRSPNSTSSLSTKPARQPAARTYTTVRDIGTGNTIATDNGSKVVFPDIPAGQYVQFASESLVTQEGIYDLAYTADPDEEITETDESNNVQNSSFERSYHSSGCSFIIREPTKEELSKIKTRYVIYRGGNIEVHN